MAQIVFTITIFVSAFMLFLVQPLIGKLILPKLGGTPQVWNTCMVFFQTALLAGYAYTHTVSTRLKLRQQLVFHAAMLGVPILMLLAFPMYAYVQGWTPPTDGNPIPTTLLLLATVVGVPFFVVSTSAPLLQKWFAYSGHPNAKDPYFLYSASNAGSLLSLLVYPTGIEPALFLETQTYVWFGGYAILGALIVYCAFLIFQTAPSDEQIAAEANRMDVAPAPESATHAPAPAPIPAAEASTAVKSGPAPATGRGIQRKKGTKLPGHADDDAPAAASAPVQIKVRGAIAPVDNWRRLRWILLAAVPSSLMLGVTSYISTDLSPFPLVWVIPLALYLLSFILVYMKPWTSKRFPIFNPEGYTLHEMMVFVGQPLGLIVVCFVILTTNHDPFWATLMLMMGFFSNALACHGELAEDRPDTKHLTEYFLYMSVGGAIGGILNGLVAPVIFNNVYEFYIAIVVAGLVRPSYILSGWFDELVLQSFPQFKNWVRTQGDEMAKSMGRTPPASTYMFSYFLDIVFGILILSISYYLRIRGDEVRYYGIDNWIAKFIRFTGINGGFALNALMFGIPMVFCFFFAGRSWRFGLATMGLLYGSLYLAEDREGTLEARRTYFGVLRVLQRSEGITNFAEIEEFTQRDPDTKKLMHQINEEGKIVPPRYPYTYLMHGTTDHGRNYLYDPTNAKFNKRYKDISRLATTYYHRYGPVGVVMEHENWFKGPQNDYKADARLPTAMFGQMIASIGIGTIPLEPIVGVWSEPPYATIGLGTGTMASYARPFQHMTYYEIDEVIRKFSVPDEGADARFTFVEGAIRRGANLQIVMGDARLSLEPKREHLNFRNSYVYEADFKKFSDAKERFYSRVSYKNFNDDERKAKQEEVAKDLDKISKSWSREKFYKVIVVDAFSSDAIPIHLVTKQAIEIYMDKLRDDGVLCVHTSNRHMDLVRPVARIVLQLSAASQKKGKELAETMTFKSEAEKDAFLKGFEINCLVGKDDSRRRNDGPTGHTGSEYVMVYRGDAFLKWTDKLKAEKEGLAGEPPAGKEYLNAAVHWYDPWREHYRARGGRLIKTPVTMNDSLWTDDFSNIMGVIRWPEWVPFGG